MRTKSVIVVSTASILLSACLVTTNLLTDGSLNSEQLNIARRIAEDTKTICIRTQYKQSGEQTGGSVALRSMPEIKKLSVSSDGWYNAEAATEGVWDNVYYNSTNGQLICGQKNWEKYSESSTIVFKQIGLTKLSVNDIPANYTNASETNTKALQKVQPLGKYGQVYLHNDPIMEMEYDTAQACAESVNSDVTKINAGGSKVGDLGFVCVGSSLENKLPFSGEALNILTNKKYKLRFVSSSSCQLLIDLMKKQSSHYSYSCI